MTLVFLLLLFYFCRNEVTVAEVTSALSSSRDEIRLVIDVMSATLYNDEESYQCYPFHPDDPMMNYFVNTLQVGNQYSEKVGLDICVSKTAKLVVNNFNVQIQQEPIIEKTTLKADDLLLGHYLSSTTTSNEIRDVFSTSIISEMNVFVNSLKDDSPNISFCEISTANSVSISVNGKCNLRSAVASCEDQLTPPAIINQKCNVHLPANSNILMDSVLGDVVISNSAMNGTLVVEGNGCHISPNSTVHFSGATRFLHVDMPPSSANLFRLVLNNFTLSHFGNATINGGAMKINNLQVGNDANGMELSDIVFDNNEGRHGGAVAVDNSVNIVLNNVLFHNNTSAGEGGSLYLETDNENVTMRNCLFKNNEAGAGNIGFASGGGIHLVSGNRNISFENCLFEGNIAIRGGALCAYESNVDLSFVEVDFIDNTADRMGGAMYLVYNNLRVNFLLCLYRNNYALDGGALRLFSGNSYMNFIQCDSLSNIAYNDGAENFGHGGAIAVVIENEFMSFIECSFTANKAYPYYGGALYSNQNNPNVLFLKCNFTEVLLQIINMKLIVYDIFEMDITSLCGNIILKNTALITGGALHMNYQNNFVEISFCIFSGNVAGYGGALSVNGQSNYWTISETTFSNNTALTGSAGAFSNSGDFVVVSKCSFIGNNAKVYGGGLITFISLSLVDCSFIANSAHTGGGLYVGSTTVDMTMRNITFARNSAESEGGGLAMIYDNKRVRLESSVFSNNHAGLTGGGGLQSSLQNNDLKIINVLFVNNSATVLGGSIYIGEDHDSILFSGVSISGSTAETGGGVFMNRFNENVEFVNCDISHNTATHGAGMVLFMDSLRIKSSTINYNKASISYGGIFISARQSVIISDSSISYNVANSQTSGGLELVNSHNVSIVGCMFQENHVLAGSCGAILIIESKQIHIQNTSFVRNKSVKGGAAMCIEEFSSNITFSHVIWTENHAKENRGALHITNSQEVIIYSNLFRANVVERGSGSAMFIEKSDVSVMTSYFADNRAMRGGGTVFWAHNSGMKDPVGLSNVFEDSNEAAYGSKWATEANHLSLTSYEKVYNVTDYDTTAPPVGMLLQDLYNQTVVTDSITSASVYVVSGQQEACNNGPGFVSGTTTVFITNGTVVFSKLEPLCAPEHSLVLGVSTSLELPSDIFFQFYFRSCSRGEYYAESICNPCDEGSYSFTDPSTLELSDMTKSDLCQPCPPHASFCSKDVVVLQPGNWRISNFSTNIINCPWHRESCLGGEGSGDELCGAAYSGPLCAICNDNYHFVPSALKCQPCSKTSSFFDPYTIVMIILVFICVLVGVYVVRHIVKGEQVNSVDSFIVVFLLRLNVYDQHTYDGDRGRLESEVFIARQSVTQSIVIYITFYQIVSELSFILSDVHFPDAYDFIVSIISVVNLSINQAAIVDCSSGASYDYITKLIIDTISPMLVLFVIWLCYRVHLCWMATYVASDHGNIFITKQYQNRYVSASLIFIYFVLPSVSVTIFQTFSCQNVGSDDKAEWYMTADYSVSCASSRYRFGFWWALIMVFIYPIGIPLLYFLLLFGVKEEIVTREAPRRSVTPEEMHISMIRSSKLKSFEMLYRKYKPQFWYWEVLETMYRVSVTGFLVLFHSTSDIIVAGITLSLFYLILIQSCRPFIDKELNRIKETSLWQIFFVFFLALLIKMDDFDHQLLTCCILITFFANFIIMLGQQMRGYFMGTKMTHQQNEHTQPIKEDTIIEMKPSFIGETLNSVGSLSPMHNSIFF